MACVLAGMIAAATVLHITRDPAPGINGDSLYYLSGADAIARSGTLAYATFDWGAADSLTPMTRVMPGLAVVLAVGRRAGFSGIATARMVQAACAFATIFAVVWLASSGAGLAGAFLAGASVLLIPTFLWVHLYVLTEPLFLPLVFATLIVMARPSPSPLTLGILAAAAVAVRYPGVAITGAVVLWMLVQQGRLVVRLRRAVMAGLPSAVLLGAWILHARQDADAQPIREFGVYGGMSDAFADAFEHIGRWIAPQSPLPLRLVIASGLAVVCVLAVAHEVRRGEPNPDAMASSRRRTLGASLVFVGCYLLVIVASRIFADPYIALHTRILLPAFLATQIALALVISRWLRAQSAPVRALIMLVLVAWFAVTARISAATIGRERDVGLDIVRAPVRESAVVRWLRTNVVGDRAIFSNHPFAVYHLIQRDARWWPKDVTADTLREFERILRARNGVLVGFVDHDPWTAVAPESVLVRVLGLQPVVRLRDGSVWELRR